MAGEKQLKRIREFVEQGFADNLGRRSANPVMHEHKVDLSIYSVDELKTLRAILSKGKRENLASSDRTDSLGDLGERREAARAWPPRRTHAG
jgi:hypothetical protein